MHMGNNNRPLRKIAEMAGAALALALFLVISPALILLWILFSVRGLTLSLRWHYQYGKHGKTFLAIYSNSPKWEKYFSDRILPIFGSKAVAVNISIDSAWKDARSIERLSHRHWAGSTEHTPIVLHFPRFGKVKAIRLYEAFMDFDKRGDESNLYSQIEKLKSLVAK